MSSDMHWRILIKNMVTHLRVGIYSHERSPQKIILNGVIEGLYSSHPQSIADCISYENIYKIAVLEWPKRSHIELLETYLIELLEYIFNSDSRIDYAKISLCKADAFKEADAVGVEAEWTRADFELFIKKDK